MRSLWSDGAIVTDVVLSVVYNPAGGPPRRVRYRETSDGYDREQSVWGGCGWRVTGSEPVTELSVDPELSRGNSEPGPMP